VAFGPNWFDPRVHGVTPIRPGISVDGNYDGFPDYVTVGRRWPGFPGKEFHVGYQPAPPWGTCGPSTHDHAVYSLTHIARNPNDCSDKPDVEVTAAKSVAKCGTPGPTVDPAKLCNYDDVYGDIQPGDDTPIEIKPVETEKKPGVKQGKVPSKPAVKLKRK
jgi:hypothetical protein